MTEATGTALPEQKSMSGFSKIWGIYFKPKEVFASLKSKSNWFLPFIIVSVFALVFVYLSYDAQISDAKTKLLSNPNFTEEQKAAGEASIDQRAQAKWGIAFTPLFLLIYIMFVSLILFFVCNVILGGSGSFKNMLSIFTYSGLVGIPEGIIKAPLVLVKGSIEKVQTSLALFLPVDLSDKFYYNFLAGFDIFNFWQVMLISLGVSVIYNFTFKKSFTTVFILWLIAILVGTVLKTALGGMFGM